MKLVATDEFEALQHQVQNKKTGKVYPDKTTKDPREVFPLYRNSAYHLAAKRIRKALRNGTDLQQEDEEKVENWRASHRHILNAWQVTLKKRIDKFGNDSIVFGQRLKRRDTIYNKLLREPTMSLPKMHDIAGCRLIFKDYDSMIRFINNLHSSKKIKHLMTKEYDYVNSIHPTNSGYRGIHDEYQYQSRKAKDRSDRWDGLFLEIQFRTIYQHAWATAVEVADMLTESGVKFNSGPEKQKEFFRLASEIIARVYEGQPSCYPRLSDKGLSERFKAIEREIELLVRLKKLRALQENAELKKIAILRFFLKDNKPFLQTKVFDSFSAANACYFELEKEFSQDNIVLVRTNDNFFGKSIRNAFRNYFSDTKDFVSYIEEGLMVLDGKKTKNKVEHHERLIPFCKDEQMEFMF